jgi:hypothetical protein
MIYEVVWSVLVLKYIILKKITQNQKRKDLFYLEDSFYLDKNGNFKTKYSNAKMFEKNMKCFETQEEANRELQFFLRQSKIRKLNPINE